jgi:hypothetical protein
MHKGVLASAKANYTFHFPCQVSSYPTRVTPLMKPRLTEHQWDDLGFEGGTIISVTQGTEYMICPQIFLREISQNFSPRANAQVACAYQLNATPDRTWQSLLQGILNNPRGGVLGKFIVEIDAQKLTLVCPPVNFRSRFEMLKTAIAQTNEAYAKEREWVMEHVKYLHERRAAGKSPSAVYPERFN